MWYIVGLGNPGKDYEQTRHNVGWLVLDRLCEEEYWGVWEKSKPGNALYIQGEIAGQSVTLLKPQTYMNRSGEAVRYIVEKHHATPAAFVVVYDDIDLPLGEVKLSFGKGDGGHNGIKSIIHALGSKDFLRIRVGIAPSSFWTGKTYRPTAGKLSRHVLGRFTRREQDEVDRAAARSVAIVRSLSERGIEKTMQEYNRS